MKQEVTQIRVIIIEPDNSARTGLSLMLEEFSGVEVVSSLSGISLAPAEIQRFQPEAVFIQVRLPGSSGFDLLHQLPPGVRPEFVMVSPNKEDAVKAFEYLACDFLHMPFTRERVHLTIHKLREQTLRRGTSQLHEKLNALFRYINPVKQMSERNGNGATKLLPVKMSGRIYFIHPGEIEFIEAAGYYIEVFAGGKKHLIRQSLTQLDAILDSRNFIRIHRSVIINLKFLKEIVREGTNEFSVKMANDSRFKISRSYKSEVFERIGL